MKNKFNSNRLKMRIIWKMINNKWKVNNQRKKERARNMIKISNKLNNKMSRLKENKDNKENKQKDKGNNRMK